MSVIVLKDLLNSIVRNQINNKTPYIIVDVSDHFRPNTYMLYVSPSVTERYPVARMLHIHIKECVNGTAKRPNIRRVASKDIPTSLDHLISKKLIQAFKITFQKSEAIDIHDLENRLKPLIRNK